MGNIDSSPPNNFKVVPELNSENKLALKVDIKITLKPEFCLGFRTAGIMRRAGIDVDSDIPDVAKIKQFKDGSIGFDWTTDA